MAAENAEPIPTMGYSFPEGAQPSVGDLIGLRQHEMMEAVGAYNAAIDAARVLEPHVERIRASVVTVELQREDEGDRDEGDRYVCTQVR